MTTLPTHEPTQVAPGGPIEIVIEARPRSIGGFTVGRLLPAAQHRAVGPFVFLDHMGPVVIEGGAADIRPHPHIGLSTVTYLFEGENVHRDSLGSLQVVRAGDLNIMTAGRGIVHSERFDPEHAGVFHGVQIWVALPDDHEDDAPSFAHHPRAALPAVAPAPGVRGRVLIGEAFGERSPVAHPSRPLLVELELDAGASVELPAGDERGVYLVSGAAAIAAHPLAADQLAVLRPDAAVRLEASEGCRALVIGGPSVGPRFIDWNFVASSRARIDRARLAWQAQQFAKIPGDDREFVPLPS